MPSCCEERAVSDRTSRSEDSGFQSTVVVGSILLATDQKLGVEQLAVGARANLVDRRRVEVDEQRSGDVFAIAGLGEEGLKGPWVAHILLVGVGQAILTKTVLQKVQLPSTVAELDTSLAQVKMKNLVR